MLRNNNMKKCAETSQVSPLVWLLIPTSVFLFIFASSTNVHLRIVSAVFYGVCMGLLIAPLVLMQEANED